MENKFYNELRKFSKVEKLKLGIVDDFDKAFNSALDKDTKIGTSLIDDLRKAEVAYKKIEDDYSKAIKLGDKAKAQAKDLGIDLPKTFINKIASAEAGIKEASKIASKIKSMYNIF